MIFQLIYVSKAVEPFDQKGLLDLLDESRCGNQSQEVTGMLLYKNDAFVQLLEGRKDVVLKLFDKIIADNRHNHVRRLLFRSVSERLFPEWSMGFECLSTDASIDGFTHFLENSDLLKTEALGCQALQLLCRFRSDPLALMAR